MSNNTIGPLEAVKHGANLYGASLNENLTERTFNGANLNGANLTERAFDEP